MKKECTGCPMCQKACNMFTCGTGGSCGHGNNKFFVIRWVLGILIILIMFSLGMRIGEFKGALEQNAGYGRMMNYGGGYYNQGYPMMGNPNIYQ